MTESDDGAWREAASPGARDETDDDNARAIVEYIADMAEQLESMARAAHLDLLAYLLAMARTEADTVIRLPADVGRPR